jgi:hypothetical protein
MMNQNAGERDSLPADFTIATPRLAAAPPRTNRPAARTGANPRAGSKIGVGNSPPSRKAVGDPAPAVGHDSLLPGIPDADRYLHLDLELACPQCGADGLIPWQQLDRVLFCTGCNIHYRVEPGRLVVLAAPQETRVQVQVRTNSSQWKGDLVRIAHPLTAGERLRDWAVDFLLQGRARWVVASAALLLFVVGIAMTGGKPARTPETEIPLELEPRALLLAEAAARHDLGVLVRLTEPGEYRALRIWLAHSAEFPAPAADEKPPEVTARLISNSLANDRGDRAVVRVCVSRGTGVQDVMLDEQWVQRGKQWYFQPVRLRAQVATTGARGAYKKASRRSR